MRRQFAIASAGRAASTTLFNTLVATLQVRHAVFPIWDFSPAAKLAEAYAGDRFDYVIVKSETFHVIEHLRFYDRTTLILLSRRDHLRQIVSHLVSLRGGRFHVAPGAVAPPTCPFRIERHEFLALAHMVLAMEHHAATADFSAFDSVERWAFEDFVTDIAGHITALGVENPRIASQTGLHHGAGTILNMDEVRGWAASLQADGLRVPALEHA